MNYASVQNKSANMGDHGMPNAYFNIQKPLYYSLSPDLREAVKNNYGTEFQPPSLTDPIREESVIHFFQGTEDTKQSKHWLTSFGRWCCQERLRAEERLLIAVSAMVGKAFRWCREFQLEYATYKEFCFLFAETFIRKICLWGGSCVYPYYLHFDGFSRGNPGHAGIGAVLTTPNQQHDFGHVSSYVGIRRNKHMAEYEALIAGLETALKCGVKCLLACGENEMVVKQVQKMWKSPADPEMKRRLSKVLHLTGQLHSFEIIFRSQRSYSGVASRLAMDAVNSFLVKLDRMTAKIKRASAVGAPNLTNPKDLKTFVLTGYAASARHGCCRK